MVAVARRLAIVGLLYSSLQAAAAAAVLRTTHFQSRGWEARCGHVGLAGEPCEILPLAMDDADAGQEVPRQTEDESGSDSRIDESEGSDVVLNGIDDDGNNKLDDVGNDDEDIQQEVIFVVIIGTILCCGCTCLSTNSCTPGRSHREPDGQNTLRDPLLTREEERSGIFANSLAEEENEWICPVCAFENRPRAKACTMCGTSRATAVEYYQQMRKAAGLDYEEDAAEGGLRITEVAPGGKLNALLEKAGDGRRSDALSGHSFAAATGAGDASLLPDPAMAAWRPRPSTRSEKDRLGDRDSVSSHKSLGEAAAGAAADAAVAAAFDSHGSGAGSKKSFNGGGGGGGGSFGSSAGGGPLKTSERQQAFMIRRFNSLTLRQKAAHRRRLWQRQHNVATGVLEWVRVSAASVPRRVAGGDAAAEEPELRVVPSGDSFGDPGHTSHSPGFTSVLNTSSPGAMGWEEVNKTREEYLSPIKKKIIQQSVQKSQSRANSGGHRGSSDDIQQYLAQNLPVPRSDGREDDGAKGWGLLDGTGGADLESIAAMPFRRKQNWFQSRIDQIRAPDMVPAQGQQHPSVVAMTVRRSHLLADSFSQIMALQPEQLSRRLRIRFKDEPGIDAGGLLREWCLLVAQDLFDPQFGLFVAHGEDSAYSINPVSGLCNELHLDYFRFAGRFIGKALLEHQTLPAHFSLPIVKHMLSIPITFSDLEFIDAEVFQNLAYLRNNPGAEALCLDFTVTTEHFGMRQTHPLVAGGEDIDVTDENKMEYLNLMFKYKMLDSVKDQLWHLLKGLYEVIPQEALSVFDYQELELLISGCPEIDMDDWKRHTRYVGLYKEQKAKHPSVKWFWEVVEDFTHEERARLLQFSTGSTRLPAQGFKALEANDGNFRLFTIAGLEKADCLYPRSHTCFNRIDLPYYSNKEELEGYLTLVINMEITGFQID